MFESNFFMNIEGSSARFNMSSMILLLNFCRTCFVGKDFRTNQCGFPGQLRNLQLGRVVNYLMHRRKMTSRLFVIINQFFESTKKVSDATLTTTLIGY